VAGQSETGPTGDALTPVEVARILRIAKNTVYELAKRGELPAYRAGKKMRFDVKDVEAYKNKGRAAFGSEPSPGARAGAAPVGTKADHVPELSVSKIDPAPRDSFIMCGQDILLDILANYLETNIRGLRAHRSYLGSYSGLHELYMGNAHLASSHLWDSATDSYTLPFLPHLLPGMDLTVVRLVRRRVGFYVPKRNPKALKGWADLGRPDLQFVNREIGSGIRVLVDGKLRVGGIPSADVPGYTRVCTTHLVAATTVARGGGDYAIGSEIAARQVSGIDFVPLQEECYDLVFPAANAREPHFAALLDRVRSPEFRLEIESLGGYDTSETGKILI